MSDSDGYVYDPAGIDREKLDYIMELKNLYRGRIREYLQRRWSFAMGYCI